MAAALLGSHDQLSHAIKVTSYYNNNIIMFNLYGNFHPECKQTSYIQANRCQYKVQNHHLNYRAS